MIGVDIDALWIDMNEPSNFCDYPCDDPTAKTAQDPISLTARDEGAEQSLATKKVRSAEELAQSPSKEKVQREDNLAQVQTRELVERQNSGSKKGLPGRDLINPLYKINNVLGSLSNRTANTDLIHQGGWTEYDTHNL
jgi:alpha-glucosidase